MIQLKVNDENVTNIGDFNLWMNDLNDGNALEMLKNFDLTNHVKVYTHDSERIIDLLSPKMDRIYLVILIFNLLVGTLSDHRLVT